MTVALACFAPQAHITAVDPASLDYGAPFTLGQAQSHISNGPLGSRVTFVQSNPIAFCQETADKFDAVVFTHCIWYFQSPALIQQTLEACNRTSKTLYIAEWSLTSPPGSGQAHVLAALTQAALEVHRAESHSNVQTVLSSSGLESIATEAGWATQATDMIQPDVDLQDGEWEVGAVKDPDFDNLIQQHVSGGREKAFVKAMRDATLQAAKAENGRIRPMSVWVAKFAN